MGVEFRLFEIPVRVQLWFLLLAYIVFPPSDPPQQLLIWIPVVFVGVLMHELGHALVGRRFGLAPAIELYALGGLTSWRSGRPLSPLRQVALSAAGPAVGLAVGGLCLVAAWTLPLPGLLSVLIGYMLWVNLGWAILNLLPILPLDGGQITASAAEAVAGPAGRRAARYFSLVVTAAISIWFLLQLNLWMLLLCGFLAHTNWQALQAEKAPPPPPPSDWSIPR
jgi:membrane-associated protease RseP (regulator of RpoE activity)